MVSWEELGVQGIVAVIRRLYSDPISGAWRDTVHHARMQRGKGVDEIPEFDVYFCQYIAKCDQDLKII